MQSVWPYLNLLKRRREHASFTKILCMQDCDNTPSHIHMGLSKTGTEVSIAKSIENTELAFNNPCPGAQLIMSCKA